MSKVLTFSRVFPAYHPKAGEPTHFVEKLWKSVGYPEHAETGELTDHRINFLAGVNIEPKHHTIRTGHRFKPGDKFSPRVWSGRPYNSKQIIIAPDIEVKKVWDIGKFGQFFIMNNKVVKPDVLEEICFNDGLEWSDFHQWFYKTGTTEKWHGQIICWNDKIEY